MTLKKFRFILMISTIVLVLVVLVFTGLLNMASFKQNYTRSLISSYQVLGAETVRKIEYAVKYGKPLDNFYEMGELLSEIPEKSTQIEKVEVLLPDGQVIYDQGGVLSSPYYIEDALRDKVRFVDESGDRTYLSEVYEEKYHVFLPIRNGELEWIGTLRLTFAESAVQSRVNEYVGKQIWFLLISAVGAVVILLVFFTRFSLLTKEKEIRQKRLLISICVILGIIQIVFGALSYTMLKNGYLETVKENTSNVLKVVQEDIAYVLDKGVPYSKMYGVGDYMHRMIESVPEIDRISIINADFTTEIVDGRAQFATEYTYTVPLADDLETSTRYIAVVDLSRDDMAVKTRNILLDTMTMVVISFLLMVEITLFLLFFLKKQLHRQPKTADAGLPAPVPAVDRTIIRPIGFVVFAAVYISSAFVPILMKELYRPLFGLSENVVLGLPISMEMFCLAVSSILAGYWIDKKGWKPSMLAGLVILSLGTFMSGMASDAVSFILSRGLVGTGFGFALMAMQNFVILDESEEAKNRAISALNSGAYAGINCGVVVGAMLADRIGYAEVFYVGFAIVLFGIFFVLKFMGTESARENAPDTAPGNVPVADTGTNGTRPVEEGSRGKLLPFFLNRHILSLFMLVIVPVSVCGMFLYYFFPLFAETVGISSSDVGRAFLLNGLCIVFLGPLLSKYSEKYLGTRMSVFVSGLFVVAAMAVFAWKGTVFAAIAAVVLLGIAEGFGITSQINYFISRKATLELGEGKALGYYSLVENFGQMIGPIVFGMLAVIGMTQGVGVISITLFCALLMFLFFSRQRSTSLNQGAGSGLK